MISIVIPALNEENSIGSTIAEIYKVLKESHLADFEIIVVNDGSTDRTGLIAREAGAVVIDHPHNVGYGKSLKDGIAKAKNDTIVISDADSTYPIYEIPNLVSLYQKGYDMVVGARRGEHYDESIIKSPLRKILTFIVEFVADRPIPDINSGLRVFSRKTALKYFDRLCDTFSFTTSITLAYMMNAHFVHYVQIEYFERTGNTKVRLFRDSVRTLQYILEAATYYNPLKIFGLFSAICLLIAFLSIIFAILFQLVSLFALGVGSILLSILIFGIGLLAVLLKQPIRHDQ